MTENKTIKPLADEVILANHELNQRIYNGMIKKDIEPVMSCVWDSQDFIFVATDGTVFFGSENLRKATYTLTAEDGTVTRLPEVWTDVRKKIDGRWIMVLDHAHALMSRR